MHSVYIKAMALMKTAMGKIIILALITALFSTGCSKSACPEDAKVRPDGTVLSRQGPECGFPECPEPEKNLCTRRPEICPMLYEPVCGSDMQTHPNSCSACASGVDWWTKGECEG